jgi:biopolymer transport protein ExbD
MKLRSFTPRRQIRLEVIPLIDIMFFLLASFMMVSLQMRRVGALEARLAGSGAAQVSQHVLNLSVDRFAQLATDEGAISYTQLNELLSTKVISDPAFTVCIRGENGATHGSVIYVLDLVRRSGVREVAIAIAHAPDQGQLKP